MRSAKLVLLATAGLIAAPALAQTAPGRTSPPTTTAPSTAATGAQTTTTTPSATTGATGPAAGVTGTAGTTSTAPAAAPTTTIAQALTTLPDHATLLRLVQAAKLEPVLAGPGPYTVFAPDDAAFSRLPPGTLDTLLAPANVASLTTILKNHVVPGALTEEDLKARITAGGGTATLQTLSGQPLTASIENGSVLLTDAVGNKSYVDKGNLRQTNGVIHGTNGISLPKLG